MPSASAPDTTQPGSNPLAARWCRLALPQTADPGGIPAPGGVAFYLVTGVAGGVESDLGTDSQGVDGTDLFIC